MDDTPIDLVIDRMYNDVAFNLNHIVITMVLAETSMYIRRRVREASWIIDDPVFLAVHHEIW